MRPQSCGVALAEAGGTRCFLLSRRQNKRAEKSKNRGQKERKVKPEEGRNTEVNHRDRKPERGCCDVEVRQKEAARPGTALTLFSNILFLFFFIPDGLVFTLMRSELAGRATARHHLISPSRKVMNTAFPWSLICSNTVTRRAPLHFHICEHITGEMWQRSQSRLCRAPLSHKRGVMCLNTAAALALNPSCSIRWMCHQEPDRWVKLSYESCNGTNVLQFYIQKGLVTLHLTNRSWQQRGLFIYQLRESGEKKKAEILLHTDWKALWGSHSPQSHICDNLNQILAAQSTSFKLGLFSHPHPADAEVNFQLLTDLKFRLSSEGQSDKLLSGNARGGGGKKKEICSISHLIFGKMPLRVFSAGCKPNLGDHLPEFVPRVYLSGGMSAEHNVPPSPLIYSLALFPSTAAVCCSLARWAALMELLRGRCLLRERGGIINLFSPNHIFPVCPGTGGSPISKPDL